MFKRIALMTALLVAPLALSPDSVDAQERGMERAAAATVDAQATGRPDAPPPGMDKRSGSLPPGILLTRGAPAEEPATEPAPDAEPEPEPDETCPVTLELVDGMMKPVDCNGNVLEG